MLPKVSIVCGPIVRRTTARSVSIWIEFDNDCVVHLRARAASGPPGTKRNARRPPDAVSRGQFTVKVGGRYYALLSLDNLSPGWLYKYGIYYRANEGRRDPPLWSRDVNAGSWWEAELEPYAMGGGSYPAFRAFPKEKTEETRIAFASCRVLDGGFFGGKGVKGEDVFELYGQHLRAIVKDRLTKWPHLLLLLGDQIYADNVKRQVADARQKDKKRAGRVLGNLNAPESILQWERDRIPGETKSLFRLKILGKSRHFKKVDIPDYAGWGEFQCMQYEDYAALYIASWTIPSVAQMLANVPTFMIFDDHEIANDWNLTGGWVEQMKKAPGWLDAIGEGLVAYWMYQGWGNPLPPVPVDDRFKILEKAALDGTDALAKLRDWFINRIKGGRVVNYYEIEIFPPILVLDTRADRSFVAPKQRGPNGVTVHADFGDEIISEEQWRWLQSRIDQKGPVVLASGVPFLQLPCADVWLLRGTRPDIPLLKDFEELKQDNADVFEFYRREIGTDQWTAFQKSFARLVRELFNRGPFIFLSGDVHYSYGMYGRADFPDLCKMGRNPMLLHAVSSPLRSQWEAKDLKTNDPEFCPSLISGGTHLDMRRSFEADMNSRNVCDLSHNPSDVMRLFLPDGAPVFDNAGKKMKWTHLNNIGILTVWRDGKSVKVSWMGASTKKGEILTELGTLASPLGTFVR